jgi:hypothetical protein
MEERRAPLQFLLPQVMNKSEDYEQPRAYVDEEREGGPLKPAERPFTRCYWLR